MPKKPKNRNAARGTKPSMYRLSGDTLAQLDRIAASIGAETRAAAIRYAIRKTVETLEKDPVSSGEK